MKKQITTIILTVLLVTIGQLYTIGKVNYYFASNECFGCSGTDAEIVEILQDYGFNLDWYQKPTTIDYVLSPIRKTTIKDELFKNQ